MQGKKRNRILPMRKGVSPLIATVLLIGITVTLTGAVMMWGQRFVMEKTQKEGARAEAQLDCMSVEFTVDKSCASGSDLKVTVRNLKNTEIDGFTFRSVKLADTFKMTEKTEGLGTREFTLTGAGSVDTIDIVPLKKADSEYLPCSTQTKTARVTGPC